MRKALLLSCMIMSALLTFAQRTVTGKVTDSEGRPIAGASVQIKNSSVGTTTAEDGTFSIVMPANATTLTISYVGLASEEVDVRNRSTITVTLQSSTAGNLQEVVVVGYGTQTRREVTGSISKIDPRPISTLVTPSLDKQLGGRAAGVLVINPSGSVNEPPRIRIRGVNSISGSSNPLIVLDGVPVPAGAYSGYTTDNLLANINPADIESVEILKDGSAAAIFGSRASNGVILITTKKGRAGKLNVNYNATFGWSRTLSRFDLLDAQQFVSIANEKLTNAGLQPGAFMNSQNTNTDWQSVVFRDPATATNHNLSIEGGSERTNYFLSFNYGKQNGLVITNSFERFNIRGNIEQRVNNWLKISNYITLSRNLNTDQNTGGNSLSGAIANALRALPNVRVKNDSLPQFDFYNITPDGNALGSDANTRLIENNYTNIAFVLAKNRFRATQHRVINNFGLELKPLSWLTYNFKGNVDYITLNEMFAQDPRHGDARGVAGRINNQAGNNTRLVLQNYINANNRIGDHSFFTTIGYENQKETGNSFVAGGTNISDPFFLQQNIVSNSFGTPVSGGGYSEGPGFVSFFGRLNYDFANKYYVQVSFRRDGLSRFASENRFGNFPAFSLGYRISNEDFWKNSSLINVINEFKIRGSWAKLGNSEILIASSTDTRNFPYLSLYGSAPYGSLPGIAATQAGNNDLSWEMNEARNLGIDAAFLNGRINFTFDYFENRNNDLVLAAPQPVSLGIPGNVINRNIGNMINKGLEFSLNGDLFRSRDFSLNLGINYTTQKNKVLSLFNNADVIVSNGTGSYNILRVGEPINALYGYEFVGVNSSNGNPVYRKADGSLVMGNITNSTYYTISDLNSSTQGAQSSLATTDRKVLGTTLPTYFGGITGTMTYKGLSLDMLWRYSGGNKIMNITRQESLMSQGFTNNGTEILQRWTKPGDVTNVPKLWYGRDNFTNLNQQTNSRFVEDGDFIRLENLQIGYGIPATVLNRLTKNNVKSFRFYLQGQNLFVITKFTGIDPDNIDVRGLNNNVIPAARTISVGLNVGF